MGRRRDRLRAAAEVRKSYREAYGDNAQAMLRQHVAQTSAQSQAEKTYRAAMDRIHAGRQRFYALDADLPERMLHPEETVYDVAVGAKRLSTFPLLIVTDRRVLHVTDHPHWWTFNRRWAVLEEAPAGEITGAEVEKKLLSGRLRVHLRHREDLVMNVSSLVRPEEVAALLNHLAAGGAPPR